MTDQVAQLAELLARLERERGEIAQQRDEARARCASLEEAALEAKADGRWEAEQLEEPQCMAIAEQLGLRWPALDDRPPLEILFELVVDIAWRAS